MSKDWSNPSNWHYAPCVFPLMSPDELEALAANIKSTKRLLNPVLICADKILDGRNRILACKAAGITPTFKSIPEKEAAEWARSQNVFRRTMTPLEQVFALEVLKSPGDPEQVLGRKRLRAYRKLKMLKDDLTSIVEQAREGLDVLPQLDALLKPKKEKVEKSIFHILADKLHLFEPAVSDGQEHLFVKEMEAALSAPMPEGADALYRNGLIKVLERLASNFSNYAQKLKEGQ